MTVQILSPLCCAPTPFQIFIMFHEQTIDQKCQFGRRIKAAISQNNGFMITEETKAWLVLQDIKYDSDRNVPKNRFLL